MRRHGRRALLAAAFAVLAGPAAAEMPAREALVGSWSFDGTCASGNGMGLAADGSLWFEEGASGLWAVDRDAVLMILQEREPGEPEVLGVSAAVLRIDQFQPDRLVGTFLDSGVQIDAVRCE